MLKALLGILIILGFVFTYFLTYYLAYEQGYNDAEADMTSEVIGLQDNIIELQGE